MAADDNPAVLIKSKNESVAVVPMKTLVQESVLFKSLLNYEKYTGVDGNSIVTGILDQIIDNIWDAGKEVATSDIDNGKEESAPKAKDDGNREDKVEECGGKGENGNEAIQSINKGLKVTETRLVTINIDDFSTESVKILFSYLAGHDTLIFDCHQFSVLKDMMQLYQKYQIHRPINFIMASIKYSEITIGDLVDVIEFSEEIVKSGPQYKERSEDLYKRVINFSRCNFASWQVIINFVVKNKDKVEFVAKIFKALKFDPCATLKWIVTDMEKLGTQDELSSPKFIVNNLEWKVVFAKRNGMVDVKIECSNPNSFPDWSSKAEVEVTIHNHKGNNIVVKKIGVYSQRKPAKSFHIWTHYNSIEKEGFIKNGEVTVEAKINVLESNGTKECLGVPEECFGFDLSKPFTEDDCCLSTNDNDSDESSRCSKKRKSAPPSDDSVVIFSCGEKEANGPVEILVRQSVLTDSSTYFASMFSQNWKKAKGLTLNPDNNQSIRLTLTEYSSNVVKTLFDYLAGFPRMLEHVDDFEELADMLRFCDFYGIQKPVAHISHRISTLKLTVKNLAACWRASKVLGSLAKFTDLDTELVFRFYTFVRANFASWQTLVAFFADNYQEEDIGLLQSVVKILACKEGDFQYTIKFDERFKMKKISSPLLFSNFLWSIVAGRHPVQGASAAAGGGGHNQNQEEDNFALFVKCSSEQNSDEWKLKLDAELHLHSTDGMTYFGDVKDVMSQKKAMKGYFEFLTMSEFTNPENQCLNEDKIAQFALKIKSIQLIKGSKLSLGVNESIIT